MKPITDFHGEHSFLSNFYRAPIKFRGKWYPTSEHAYQAAKARDVSEAEAIRQARTAGEAKRLGQRVALVRDFELHKVDVMREILKLKFAIPELRELLLGTGDAELIEGNTWGDRWWGKVDGVGENWLGRLLMEIRSELRSNE